jgi:NMD protein affecting ribosome stability and mRNA decay
MCFHNWSKWSEAFDQQVSPATSLKQQSKVCKECGKIRIRNLWLSTYTASKTINEALEAQHGSE